MKLLLILTLTACTTVFNIGFATPWNQNIPQRIILCTKNKTALPNPSSKSKLSLKDIMKANKERQCLIKILNESSFSLARARFHKTNNLSSSYTSFKTTLIKTVKNIEAIYDSVYCPVSSVGSCNPQLKLKAKMKANHFFKTILLMLEPVKPGSTRIIPPKLPLE